MAMGTRKPITQQVLSNKEAGMELNEFSTHGYFIGQNPIAIG
jgi:hypothetical protein